MTGTPQPPQATSDQQLLERLIAAGRIPRDRAPALAAEAQKRGVRVAALLQEKGVPDVTASGSFAAVASKSGVAPRPATSPSPEVQAALADPKRRVGNYVILRELGRGAMGVVYRAYDLANQQSVAIKVLLGQDKEGLRLKRFKLEAEAARRLKHPAIVAAREIGEHEGRPYFVMELVEGESLEKLLARPLPPKWIAQLVRGLALALSHAHGNGVVHRDVKPENVIVDREGQPHLTDFGLARDLSNDDERMTQEGQMLGTPAYMAPELTGETTEQGPPVDVYSVGAILYRALVGRPPFSGAPSMAALIKKILFEPPVPPREVKPDVDPALEAITLRCLEKDPAKRPAASELAAELESYLGFVAAPAEPDAPPPGEEAPPPEDEEGEDEDEAPAGKSSRKRRLGVSSSRHRAARPSSTSSSRVGRARDRQAEEEKRALARVLMILIPLGLLFLIGVAFLSSK